MRRDRKTTKFTHSIMSIKGILVLAVLLVANGLTSHASEVTQQSHSTFKYGDNPPGNLASVVTLPSSHSFTAEDRSGICFTFG